MPTYNQLVQATPGLQSYWRLVDAKSPTHADTGTTITAAVGSVTGHSPKPMKFRRPGRIGRSVYFNGLNSRINFGDNYGFPDREPFTVEFWYRRTNRDVFRMLDRQTTGGRGVFLVQKGKGKRERVRIPYSQSLFWKAHEGGHSGWFIQSVHRRGHHAIVFARLKRNAQRPEDILTTPKPFNLRHNRWYHIACTYDGTHKRVFIDGVLRGRQKSVKSIPNNGYDLLVGSRRRKDQPPVARRHKNFQGKLDEIAIYNRALSASEIQEHYHNYDRIGKEAAFSCSISTYIPFSHVRIDHLRTEARPTFNVEADFDWAPKGDPIFYDSGLNSYDSGTHEAPVNEPITFTATARVPGPGYVGPLSWGKFDVEPTHFEWDFGDGATGVGQQVQHTYRFANPHTRVSLKVTDSLGREVYASHILPLTA